MRGQGFKSWLVQGLKLGFRVAECSLVFSPTRPSITTLCLAVYADTPIGSKLIVGGCAPATHPKNLSTSLRKKLCPFSVHSPHPPPPPLASPLLGRPLLSRRPQQLLRQAVFHSAHPAQKTLRTSHGSVLLDFVCFYHSLSDSSQTCPLQFHPLCVSQQLDLGSKLFFIQGSKIFRNYIK